MHGDPGTAPNDPTASVTNIDPVVSGKTCVGRWQLEGAESQRLLEKTVDARSSYQVNNYEYCCRASETYQHEEVRLGKIKVA